MTAEIIKILPLATSRNGNKYKRVEMKIIGSGKFMFTDLCPDYRNYSRWARKLKVGNVLTNLVALDETRINADSYPRIAKGRELEILKAPLMADLDEKKLCQMGVFG